MNNKKVQAHMQIDVSFVANTTKLVKELENSTKKLNLGSVVTRDLATNLSKGFKEVYGNLDKMATGLSKKGLSSKQYTAFFDSINDRLQQSLDFTQDLKKSLSDAFNSPENKQAIKDLEDFKKQLIEINKLASQQSASLTRQNTAKNKLKEETGLDFDTSRKMLNSILKRRANKQDLTRNQQDWAQANGLDEGKLKRALELMRQINSQAEKITDLNNQAKNITGQNGVAPSVELLEKNIAKLENNVFSQSAYKQNLQIADGIEQIDAAVRKTAGDLSPQYTKALSDAERESQKLAQASSTIREIFAQFGIAFSATTIVRGFQDLARSAFDFYKSLDSALNEIYVVSNLSSDAVDGLQDKFINMAKNTGMALDDVTRSAVLFYQQGLNTSEVMEMTRVTSEFAKVAGIDATDAADKLTAAVNGYCLAAEDASSVADKFNKVAAATAADINELSTAFSKAAAQANQAGVSMDNYLAYIATMEEATREAPENIGTSLKTIFSRMQQIKTGNNTEDTTDVNQVETALKSVGIALRDAQGELRDLEEIFDELGPKWNSLDRNTQAYLGTIIAGTRQQSRFITLMQNWDRVLEVSEQSANSAGMQALMHAKAMDSIESKLQQLQVAWQEFVSNLASSDLFKGAIEGLTNLIKLINSGNKPMILLAGAIALIGKRLKDLQAPMVNKVKDFAAMFSGKNKFTSEEERKQALEDNSKQVIENNTRLSILYDQHKQKMQEILMLEQQMQNPKNQTKENEDKINQLKQEQLDLQNQINQAENKGSNLSAERRKIEEAKIMTKGQKLGSTLSTVGMGISAVGMMSGDANTAGLLGGVGTGVMAAGQFATGNFLGGTITAITSVYQLLKTIKDWDKNLAKKISDAVDSVNTKIEDVNNKGTVIRSSNKLIEKYEQLSKKIVKTAAEQEQLNNIVQELGDTHSVDVISDEYGNLLIDINEVKKKVEELNEERKKGIDELREQELEAIENATSGFMNTNKVSDYYEELFKTVGSKYRDLLADMDDGLTKETRNISETMSKTLMSNIKNELVENAKNHAGSYIESGIGKGLTQQQEAFNNLSSDAWNELYAKIGNVKEDLNSLTFNEVQERMNEFYNDWAKQNGIAEENLEALKKSVNDTLYGDSSIMQYYNQIDAAESKVNKTYYAKEKEDLKNLISLNNYKTKEIAKTMIFDPAAIQLMKGIALYDQNKTTRAAQKRLEEIRKEEQKELEKIAKEHGFRDNNGEYDTKGAEKWLNAQVKIRDSLKDTTAQTQEFLTSIKSFTDFDSLGPDQAEKMSKMINNIIPQLEQETTAEGKTNLFVKLLNEQLDNVDDEQLKEKLQELINDSFNNLELPQGYTFTQIADSLDTISERLITINDLVAEFNDKGALTLDEFKDLANILDNFNPEDLFAISDLDNGVNYVNDYIDALKRLDLAYDANNGMITMNGEALNDLRAIQEAQSQAQITALRNELVAKKTQVEAEIGYIDAQIAGTDAAIEAIKAHAESGAMGSDILTQADDRVQDSFSKTIQGLQENYSTDVQNMNSWTQAVLGDLSTATEAWGRYWKAVAGKGDGNLDDLHKQAEKGSKKVKWEGAKKFDIQQDKFYNSTELNNMLGQMSSYRSSLENLKAKYQSTLELYNTQIGLLDSLKGADLSKLGGGTPGSGSDTKLTQYIGKLKEIFNILNRIQVLEHRLSTLDAYADIAQGERYGNLLKERLEYNEELLDQYEFLTREQKQFTNGYKDFINSVEGLEGVFDFDQFGQIIINWDKYVALQDVAVDNEVTLKEKADDVYDTYTQMFTDLHGYFDKTIEYYKTVIELQQEMVDSYISIQNQVADAVKEIYKKILDTKLDAIDQEKDALDELRQARERANKDTKNAQAVSELQTNLQRAMMDTSGASDTAFIKSQKDIQNKLDEIAEDKYSTMLQDIQDKLDEEKDALQREFDDMFEQLDWLFQWIDDDIMGDESMIYQILEQTDEWNQSSFLERQQKLDEWKTQFYTYYQSVVENERGIYGIYDNITSTKERIGILDSNLQLSISKGSAEIAQTLGKWAGDISSSINNLSSRVSSYGGGGGGGYSGGSSSPSGSSTSSSNSSSNYVYISCADGYTQNVPQPKKVKKGSKFSPPSISRSGYTLAGWDVPSAHMCINAGGSFTATVSETIVAVWKKASSNSIVSNFGKWLGFDTGGLADFTGPAWLDGTKQHPEMVLNQLQTKHFINFANTLDKMYSNVGSATGGLNSSVTIGSIGFQVDSMSSPEDGEKAFNMFVDKFKEIGNQTGIKINSFKNTL